MITLHLGEGNKCALGQVVVSAVTVVTVGVDTVETRGTARGESTGRVHVSPKQEVLWLQQVDGSCLASFPLNF